MIYRDFQGLRLSLLGFGTMRLPTTAEGDVDEGGDPDHRSTTP